MKLKQNKTRPTQLSGETLEAKHMLSATSWIPHAIEDSPVKSRFSEVVDIDSDGDFDVLLESNYFGENEESIQWSENTGGGVFTTPKILVPLPGDARVLDYADMDGDQDIDIIINVRTEETRKSQLAWIENDGLGAFGTPKVIHETSDSFSYVTVSDIDTDGDSDLIATDSLVGKTYFFKQKTGDGFAPAVLIASHDSRRIPQVLDFDGDGDMDLAFSKLENDTYSVYWVENEAGFSGGGSPQLIANNFASIDGYDVADFDNDGRDDLLVIQQGNRVVDDVATFQILSLNNQSDVYSFPDSCCHRIALHVGDTDSDGDTDIVASGFQNGITLLLNNNGRFDERISIYDGPVTDVDLSDVNSDGHTDIVARGEGDEISLFLNNEGQFNDPIAIHQGDLSYQDIVAIADVNGDNVKDVLTRDLDYGELAWLESLDSTLGFSYAQPPITFNPIGGALGISALDIFDADGDMDNDVLLMTSREIILYENDGVGFLPRSLGQTRQGQFSYLIEPVKITDFDSNGDPDFIVAQRNGITWWKNSRGTFEPIDLFDQTLESLIFHDINGDGQENLIVATSNETSIFSNRDGELMLLQTLPLGGDLHLQDFDADGDGDLVLSTNDRTSIFANREGEFQLLKTLPSGGDTRFQDFDGDGDNDLFLHSDANASLYLFDGGAFSLADSLPETYVLDASLLFHDLDDDGDIDIIVNDEYGILVYTLGENDSYSLTFDWHGLDATVADIDDDGDLDLVAFDDALVYLQNVDGVFVAKDETSIDKGNLSLRDVRDIDNDGDLDVLMFDSSVPEYNWYENQDGQGNFVFRGEALQSLPSELSYAVDIIDFDFDSDGDFDLLVDFHFGHRIYENVDGTFVDVELNGGHILLRDVDNDNEIDAIVLSNHVARWANLYWYENRRTGDADDDGAVSFSDFLALSANFGKQVDAVWEDGDFNADGEVSFADFLLLSQNFGQKRA